MRDPIRKLDERESIPREFKPLRFVVAGLILRDGADSSREVLICQRRPEQPMSLKWEFPGGKIEPGESSEAALARELNEELGICAVIGSKVASVHHKYRNGGAIDLQFFLVESFTGEMQNLIFNEVRWCSLAELPGYDFLAADLGLIRDLSEGRLLPANGV